MFVTGIIITCILRTEIINLNHTMNIQKQKCEYIQVKQKMKVSLMT